MTEFKGSIHQQIALLVGLVLSVAIAMFGAVAYRTVRQAALETSDARLVSVTDQFATLLGQSFAAIRDSARVVVANKAVVAALAAPDFGASDAVRRALAPLGPVQGAITAVELRRNDGSVAAALTDSTRQDARAPRLATAAEAVGAVSALYAVRDTVRVEVSEPVRHDGVVSGFVVQSRRVFSSAAAVRQLTALIGADATLLIGNSQDSVWTDLVRPIERPVLARTVTTYMRDGTPRRGVMRMAVGTPLAVAVDVPLGAALAVPHGLIGPLAAFALVIVGVGAFGGWLLSRRIVSPLQSLVTAAETISSGGVPSPVSGESRSDEIGRLARTFNVMVNTVSRSRESLEAQLVVVQNSEAILRARTDELARSNAELEQFAYVASHDLQEPLRTITSYVQLLQRRYRDQLGGDAAEFIDFVVEGAERMQRLIQDLLVFSRVGSRGAEFASTDSAHALSQALRSLTTAITESGAVVSHDPLPTVVADEQQLVQLFTNLLSNAIKFRTDAAPRVHVSAERSNGEVTFSVRDNGIGIEPSFRDRVFLVFQRLHGRKEFPGTGIGLAIARKIVERHGGRIWIASESGPGTTFRFTIPAAES